jgi:predicted GIY-YIG superfamily endonuclease
MAQLLLIPDPRPLVDLLGAEFFRQAPEAPGVYLMRDAMETVIYVGKAKNLRQRIANYRVANPDRMPRRHLRLLRTVARIEFQECASESAAIVREAELLKHLRPRFNRAGTWPGAPRYFAWRENEGKLEFAVPGASAPGWHCYGPIGSATARFLRASLLRLLGCALFPERGLAGLPEGWFAGRHGERATLVCAGLTAADYEDLQRHLTGLCSGRVEAFAVWVRERTILQTHPFETTVREADLEQVVTSASRFVG